MARRNVTLFVILFLVGIFGTVMCQMLLSKTPSFSTRGTANTSPLRLICASPAICEIVFRLGAGSRVIGVSEFCVYPPEATVKEKMGGWANPNRERILALQPDLVLTQGKHEVMEVFCKKNGIGFYTLPLDSLNDIQTAVFAIGRKLDALAAAETTVREMNAVFQAFQNRADTKIRPSVFLTFSRTPGKLSGLMTPGPGTFLTDLIDVAGGRNIFSDAKGPWPQVSKEALLLRQPDVILEVFSEAPSSAAKKTLRNDWQRLSLIPAVKTGRIHFLSGDFYLVPGPRVTQIAKAFFTAIHAGASDE